MAVRIVTDSLSDIPSNIARELGVSVIPVIVNFGTDSFRDQIDLSTDEFYYKLVNSSVMPTTAAPPVGSFLETYEELSKETDEIISIHISSKLSATYTAALEAKEMMEGRCRIEEIDSRTVIGALALIVIAAAGAALSGVKIDELTAMVYRAMPRAYFRMAFDTLEFLKRGGRIGKAQAFMGSLLKTNPILGLKDGEVFPFGRERSRTRATNWLFDYVSGFSDIGGLAVEHATTPEEADKLADRLGLLFPRDKIVMSKVSPVVGAHVGPHVLAVSVLQGKFS